MASELLLEKNSWPVLGSQEEGKGKGYGQCGEFSKLRKKARGKVLCWGLIQVGKKDGEGVKKVGDVERKVGDVERKVGDVGRKVGDVERKVGDVRRRDGEVRTKVGDVGTKVGDVGRKVGDVGRKVGDVGRRMVGGGGEECSFRDKVDLDDGAGDGPSTSQINK